MTSYKYIEARVGPISQHSIKLNNLSADGVCAQMGVSISINLYIKNVPVYTSVSLPVSYYKQRHCTCAFCIMFQNFPTLCHNLFENKHQHPG